MSGNESLTDLLMVETSRRNTDLIANLVSGKLELFDELVLIYLRNEEPLSHRAVWVVDTELADSIEWRIGEGTPGFKSRGLKTLKKLYKEMNSDQFV